MAMTLHNRLYGDTRPALLILLGAVGVLLLTACANVCNLLLARGARRQTEFALRVALGASRGRLTRSLLTESIVMSLGGGLLGLLVPLLAVGWFVRMAPSTISQVERIQVDATVLGFTFAIAVAAGLLVGIVPALEAGRRNLSEALSRSIQATISPRQHRLGRILIVVELATALVLLTCAGLLTRSFARVLAIDTGFRPEGVLVVAIDLPPTRYSDESAARFLTALLERARGLHGVESAALADAAPLDRMRASLSIRQADGRQTPIMELIAVSPGYFATVGTPLLAGRDFSRDDRAGRPPVAIVNATLARLMYPGLQPTGQRLPTPVARGGQATIIGVVKDASRDALEAEARPAVFVPVGQTGVKTSELLMIRTAGDPINLQRPVQQLVRSMDTALPAPSFRTMEQVLSTARAPRRFSFVLLTIFALLAATLAAVGLYGVMAYLVADRTREMGIRLALGAEPRRLVRLVVSHGMWLAVLGVIIGVGGSLAAVRLLRRMLFGVSIYDPWTFAAGSALLTAVAFAACWVPARRAARIDPIVALRAD